MTYTITCTKGTRTAATIGEALRVAGSDELREAAFGHSVTNDQTGEDVSVELIDGDSISVEDAQALLRLAGIDPREDDTDGFHWPHAPSVQEAAAALDRWTQA